MIELVLISILAGLYIIYFFYWIRAFQISAPYYPTSKKAIAEMIHAIDSYKIKHIVELGAGDGRVAIALSKKGYTVTAVEFNPILAALIYLRKIIGRHKNLKVVRKDFLKISYNEFDAAFIYLYPKVMKKLSKKIRSEMKKESVLVSNTFEFHDLKPIHKANKIFVYLNE
jgi:16S rRNA A1518/A1519 N6-dimethyltransferase RsmA/KsgA/DIM1 with predicted DNA glycosylase/AP lyase activity